MVDIMRKAPRTDRAIDVAMSVIEGRWKTFIISTLASNGAPMRFNQLIGKVDGISPRILTLHLRELEQDGVIFRDVVSTSPKYVEYSLTDRGSMLIPILDQLAEWGLQVMSYDLINLDTEVVKRDEDGIKV